MLAVICFETTINHFDNLEKTPMTFESFTFKPNPKKVKEDNMYTLSIVGGIFLFVLTYIFFFAD